MSEREVSLGRLFVEEAIKAGTWGIIFLLIMGMFIISIKQDIKEGIAFGMDRFVTHVALYVTDPYLIGKTKQLVKEGIEYSLIKASKEARILLKESPGKIKEEVQESKKGTKKSKDQ